MSASGAGRWTCTQALILANVVVFALRFLLSVTGGEEALVRLFALHPAAVAQGWLWQVGTYAFLHGDLWHILWNMLFLWWFGQELESAYGAARYLRFYLASGLVGGIAYVAWGLLSPGRAGYAVGASACVMGVVVLSACREPRRIIHLLLFFVLPIPIQLRYFALVFVAGDLIGFAHGAGGVAHVAHLGGAAWAGAYWLARERGWDLRLARLFRFRRRRLRLHASRAHGPSAEMRAEVDRLLAKISQGGIDALSKAEQEYLARASRQFRQQ